MTSLRLRRLLSSVSLTASGLFPAAAAHAEVTAPTTAPAAAAAATTPSGDDAVYMKDGSLLRGVLVEMMPGDHVSIQLPTGQVAVVRWDAITRVERATRVDVKAPPPAVPTTVQTAGAGQALVHIETDKPLQVETHIIGREWRFACDAPCDIALDLDKAYRIIGDGVRPSPTFRIAAAPGGRVVLDVATASKSGLVGGIVMASVGAPLMLIGGVIVAVGGLSSASGLSTGDGEKKSGWIVFGIGAGGLVGGVILILTNARTNVVQSNGNTLVRPDERAEGYVRRPAWNDARLDTRPLDPRAVQTVLVPLYSGRF